jgi:hypothetical protein
MTITISLPKAKQIAHNQRRARREAELAPLDQIIAKQIPGKDAADAEAKRQVIRARYDKLQADIDKAKNPEQLKTILGVA